jgi:hypothetical protein
VRRQPITGCPSPQSPQAENHVAVCPPRHGCSPAGSPGDTFGCISAFTGSAAAGRFGEGHSVLRAGQVGGPAEEAAGPAASPNSRPSHPRRMIAPPPPYVFEPHDQQRVPRQACTDETDCTSAPSGLVGDQHRIQDADHQITMSVLPDWLRRRIVRLWKVCEKVVSNSDERAERWVTTNEPQ